MRKQLRLEPSCIAQNIIEVGVRLLRSIGWPAGPCGKLPGRPVPPHACRHCCCVAIPPAHPPTWGCLPSCWLPEVRGHVVGWLTGAVSLANKQRNTLTRMRNSQFRFIMGHESAPEYRTWQRIGKAWPSSWRLRLGFTASERDGMPGPERGYKSPWRYPVRRAAAGGPQIRPAPRSHGCVADGAAGHWVEAALSARVRQRPTGSTGPIHP